MKDKMRMIGCCLVLVTVLLVFAGCAGEGSAEIPPTETVAATEAAEPTELAATEPEKIPFEDYEYLYTDERDRAWEEDVVFLAKVFLGVYPADGHPLLVDDEFTTYKTGAYIGLKNSFDKEKRSSFINQIMDLIDNIPTLSDAEIIYEMQRIIATLSDAHSSLTLPLTECFPFTVEEFYSDEGVELRIVRIPAEYREALYGKLVAINGVPIEDVIERLSEYISYENENIMMFHLTDLLYNAVLVRKEALQVIGVLGAEEDTVQLEVVTEQGEHIVAEVPAVTQEENLEIKRVKGDWYSSDKFSLTSYQKTNYWHEYTEETGTLYVRFNREREMTQYRYSAFIEDIVSSVKESSPKKLIVDLRYNFGGNMSVSQDFIDAFLKMNFNQIYILIDGNSYSNAVTLATELHQKLPDSLLVGTPAGQSPNFFAAADSYKLPNSGYSFTVSDVYYSYWEDYPYDALMPDITVYQTLEDYKQGIDTVLEYVRNIG